jgi:O-antigen/teichoic acid export membrane protein
MNLKKTLIYNTFFSAFPRVGGAFFGFLTIPIIISSLGIENFGIWSVLLSFSSYFFILDFGLNSSLIRQVAQSLEQQHFDRLNGFIFVSFTVYLFLAIPLCVAAFIYRGALCSFFQIPNQYQICFFLTISACFTSGFSSLFGSVFNGMQKMHFSSGVQIFSILISNVGSVVLIYRGYGIHELSLLYLFSSLTSLILMMFLFYRLMPSFKFVKPNLNEIRYFFKFGLQLYITSICSFVVLRSDMLLIAVTLGPTASGYYRIASSIALLIREIPELLTPALYPAAVHLYALKEHEKISALYLRSFRYIFLISLTLTGFVLVNSESLLKTWLNTENVSNPSQILQLLATAYFFNIITAPATIIARAVAMQKWEMFANIIMTILHLTLNIFLLTRFQEQGIGWASFLAISIVDILLFFYLNFIFKYSFSKLFFKIIGTALATVFLSLVISSIFLYLFKYFQIFEFTEIRFQIGIPLLIASITFFIIQFTGWIKFQLLEFELVIDLINAFGFSRFSRRHSTKT